MCIVVVKPKGVEFPTWKTLENCFNRNPDGAGFMYNGEDGKVHIHKGFMSFGLFKKALKLEKRQMNEQTTVVMHFRIKTHGDVSPECCHPFPLEGKLEYLRKTECVAQYGVAHNGIILGRNTNARKSDTMDYILNVLYPLYKLSDDIVHDKYAKHLINDTIDHCKLAILDGNGVVDLTGDWVYEDGIAYSNSTYKAINYLTSPQRIQNTSNYAAEVKGQCWQWNTKKGEYELVNHENSSGYYDATAAEIYGYGYDEYDTSTWEEDYSDEQRAFAKTVREGWPCKYCDEFITCVESLQWFCENEHEANLMAYWYREDGAQNG